MQKFLSPEYLDAIKDNATTRCEVEDERKKNELAEYNVGLMYHHRLKELIEKHNCREELVKYLQSHFKKPVELEDWIAEGKRFSHHTRCMIARFFMLKGDDLPIELQTFKKPEKTSYVSQRIKNSLHDYYRKVHWLLAKAGKKSSELVIWLNDKCGTNFSLGAFVISRDRKFYRKVSYQVKCRILEYLQSVGVSNYDVELTEVQ